MRRHPAFESVGRKSSDQRAAVSVSETPVCPPQLAVLPSPTTKGIPRAIASSMNSDR
jgi:hypothetical protein